LLAGLIMVIIGFLQIQSSLLVVLALVSLGALFVRWQLVFPAIAVDRALTLSGSWKLTKGQGIRLFWALLLAVLPFALGSLLIDEIFGLGKASFILSGTLSFEAALGFVLSGLNGFAILALVVAVASGAYRRLGPE
jgi:hypothetical protein